MKKIFLLITASALYAHWDFQVVVTVPDSLKTGAAKGELRLWEDRFAFDSAGIDSYVFGHFDCVYDVHISLDGYYTVKDSLFNEKMSCETDTVQGVLDFFEKGPRAVSQQDTTIYRFMKSVIKTSGVALPGRPIRSYTWVNRSSYPLKMTPNLPDSSSIEIVSSYVDTIPLTVVPNDDYGSGYPDPMKLIVIEQPLVNNEMHWNITFEEEPGKCHDVAVTFIDSDFFKVGTRLDLKCGQFDTTYYGRAEAEREIWMEVPGFYNVVDTLCNMCSCEFYGLEKNPAQKITCNVNFKKGPVADAGMGKNLQVGNLYFLDASGSTPAAPDKPILKYIWDCDIERSTASCIFFDPDNPEALVPFVTRDTGTLVFNLQVFDGTGYSARDEVIYRSFAVLSTGDKIPKLAKGTLHLSRLSPKHIRIQTESGEEILWFQILDTSGRMVSGGRTPTWNGNRFANGVYTLRAQTQKGILQKTFLHH